jgi:hypothetical protein
MKLRHNTRSSLPPHALQHLLLRMRKYQPKPARLLPPLLPRIQPHSALQYPPCQLLFPPRIIIIPSFLPLRLEISRQINPQEIPRIPTLPIRDAGLLKRARDGDIVLRQLRSRQAQQLVHKLRILEHHSPDMAARAARRVQQANGLEGALHLGVRGDERADMEACGAEVFGEAVFDVEEPRVDGVWEGGRDVAIFEAVFGAGEFGRVHGEEGGEARCRGLAWFWGRRGEDGEGVDLVAYEVDVVVGAETH